MKQTRHGSASLDVVFQNLERVWKTCNKQVSKIYNLRAENNKQQCDHRNKIFQHNGAKMDPDFGSFSGHWTFHKFHFWACVSKGGVATTWFKKELAELTGQDREKGCKVLFR